MTVTPNSMPRKVNLIRQQILAGLIDTRPVSVTFKSIDPKTDEVVKTKVTRPALVSALAQNVSDLNVNRMAKRWAA